MKPPENLTMKTLLHILLKLALATLGLAQPPTLPVEREITDAQGRQMAGTVLTINGGSIKFRRASDGKEFDIALDKLSVPDRMFLNIDPPDALESQGNRGQCANLDRMRLRKGSSSLTNLHSVRPAPGPLPIRKVGKSARRAASPYRFFHGRGKSLELNIRNG